VRFLHPAGVKCLSRGSDVGARDEVRVVGGLKL